MSLATFYTKIFGLGLFLGGALEAVLVKSNYYQMLAASEAKQRVKALEQVKEDMERLKRISQPSPEVERTNKE
ncbi:hypothetical protein LRAMOSA03804 [Lichtheimia ramosa]|uniref:Uncharacterized protein n=1 Tax=Lichtheimia ramosa TaxID=688394 RepID=A0A077WV91_9FUNG|nr:hypothetical protein LRAMOSA03804 [Lichtheimia ramosa]